MGIPVMMVVLRSWCSLQSERHFSISRWAGKEYTMEDAWEESCRDQRAKRMRGMR